MDTQTKAQQWKTFLAKCVARGFTVNSDYHVFRQKAEFYKWGQWTVEIGCVGDFEPSQIYVERYFDHEACNHRAKYVTFSFDEKENALDTAQAWRRALTGDLMSEAFASCESL